MLEYPFQLNELEINETVEIEDIEYFIGTESRTGCWLIVDNTLYLGKVHQFIIEENDLNVSKEECIFGYYYNNNAVIDGFSFYGEDDIINLLKNKFEKIFVLNMSDTITRLARLNKHKGDRNE